VGVTGVTVQRNTARITGLVLKESQKVRLRRLASKAVVKDDEVVVPVSGPPDGVAPALVALLAELLPADDDAALTSAAP
jgi:hypothetical protein